MKIKNKSEILREEIHQADLDIILFIKNKLQVKSNKAMNVFMGSKHRSDLVTEINGGKLLSHALRYKILKNLNILKNTNYFIDDIYLDLIRISKILDIAISPEKENKSPSQSILGVFSSLIAGNGKGLSETLLTSNIHLKGVVDGRTPLHPIELLIIARHIATFDKNKLLETELLRLLGAITCSKKLLELLKSKGAIYINSQIDIQEKITNIYATPERSFDGLILYLLLDSAERTIDISQFIGIHDQKIYKLINESMAISYEIKLKLLSKVDFLNNDDWENTLSEKSIIQLIKQHWNVSDIDINTENEYEQTRLLLKHIFPDDEIIKKTFIGTPIFSLKNKIRIFKRLYLSLGFNYELEKIEQLETMLFNPKKLYYFFSYQTFNIPRTPYASMILEKNFQAKKRKIIEPLNNWTEDSIHHIANQNEMNTILYGVSEI